MAAYGLYTHIQSNKRRSIALLIGLFVLVYVLVFAGALLAEAVSAGDAPARLLLQAQRAVTPALIRGALGHRGHHPLDFDRLQIPSDR